MLRAVRSFTSNAGGQIERQALYFVIDLLLLFGVLAMYAQNHAALGLTIGTINGDVARVVDGGPLIRPRPPAGTRSHDPAALGR